ncbi:hypothetical protein NM688_g9381 [Phlebia brevispora]|uniref:Uncharacterized protein n=1 Tax=Phlebia brevispora TaxID=194682 RepID=A0ACC1RHT9_9APHY|nr:hypothetical protein NM688_g9381 [Phlebia brevispora]
MIDGRNAQKAHLLSRWAITVECDVKSLTNKEVDIVFKWLKFLRDYFYAGGEGSVPLEGLQNQKYRDILSIRLYYEWHTDALMEEIGKDRKREKQKEKEGSNGETILWILRMRPGTFNFIAQQLFAMNNMQAEREAQEREAQKRKLQRPKQQAEPPVPPLPISLS